MVDYRPGRIQSINAEQEVILKQFYAYMFKYLGYELDFDNDDLAYKECYISSTRTQELSDSGFASLNYGLFRTTTKDSTTSSHVSHKTSASSYSTLSKKKKAGGILKRGSKAKNEPEVVQAPESSRRLKFIQSQSSFEQYKPIDINPRYAYLYSEYYKMNFENSDDYMSDNEEYDDDKVIDDVSSFITAETFVDEPDMSQFVLDTSKARTVVGHYEVEPFTVKPNTSILSVCSKYDPKVIQKAIIGASRNDAFDNFVLRFVRARKFKTEDAISMILKSCEWRQSNYKPDEWLYEGDAVSYVSGKNPGFIKNFTTQKSYMRGVDKDQNPIFFFKAKLHLISDAPLADTQRFALFTIESCRLFLRDINESVDTCSIVFDLSGFSLKNADYNAIKFLAEVFEAHYPECLGKILIFNAPWIFSTVWNVIKNWLDPVVASKIHFTKDFKELSKFIDLKHIPDYMGGEDTYAGEYPIPTEKDARYMKQRDGEFIRLKRKRDELFLQFLTTTKKWIESTSPEISDRYLQDKIDLGRQLAENYIALDPYLRTFGFYDRNGSLTVKC